MFGKTVSKLFVVFFTVCTLTLMFNAKFAEAERTLNVRVGDWVKYEYVTIVAAGQHPWVKFEVQKVEGTKVTVLWTTGVPSGVSIPSGIPAAGLTVSWDILTGVSPYSYFIIHANPKIGDPVNVGLLSPLHIEGETAGTYAGVSRTVVYASYSAFGLECKYYWDKETGVLLEYSWIMGGVELTMKTVETSLWQTGFGGIPLWIIGVIVAIIAIVTIVIVVSLRKKASIKGQAGTLDVGKQQTKSKTSNRIIPKIVE